MKGEIDLNKMSKKYIMLGALIMVVIVGVLFYKLTGTSRLVKQYEDIALFILKKQKIYHNKYRVYFFYYRAKYMYQK